MRLKGFGTGLTYSFQNPKHTAKPCSAFRRALSMELLETRRLLAVMVEDAIPGFGINQTNYGSEPSNFVEASGTVYFVANDGVNGKDLWRSNSLGVAELVEDDIPGGGIILPDNSNFPTLFANANGTFYFSSATDGSNQNFWRIEADGIARPVQADIPNLRVIAQVNYADAKPIVPTNLDGTLYFRGAIGSSGYELIRIRGDGIAEVVEDEIPGDGIRPRSFPSADSDPTNLFRAGGTTYFSANDGTNGIELWRINGLGIAEMVDDASLDGGIASGWEGSNPSRLTDFQGTLYFRAYNNQTGSELWRVNSNGIAELVEDINAGSSGSTPEYLSVVGQTLYFSASDPSNGSELRRLGATGLSELVEDSSLDGGIAPGTNGSFPTSLINVNGTLFFTAQNAANGRELWRVGGAGIAELVDDNETGDGIREGTSSSSPISLTNVLGSLYFRANDGANGSELWRVNSNSIAEMVQTAQSVPGIFPGSLGSDPDYLLNVNGSLYFRASDGVNGVELWRVNGNGAAELVEDVILGGGITPGSRSGSIRSLANVDGTLYFSGDDGRNGRESWRINPTGIAEMINGEMTNRGVNTNANSAQPSYLTNVDGTLYFSAIDETNGSELWKKHGNTPAEIVRRQGLDVGINAGFASASPSHMINVNGTLYFVATNGIDGQELWRLDSSGVAEMVENTVAGGGINPGALSSNPTKLMNVAGTLYFAASDSNGQELWRVNANGTAEMVEDGVPGGGINTGQLGSNPQALMNMNGTLFFKAQMETIGYELWRINSSGIAEVVDDGVGPPGFNNFGSRVEELVDHNGTIYFSETTIEMGFDLWRINSNGVAEVVEDSIPGGGIHAGFTNVRQSDLTIVNGTLYFSADNGSHGQELWKLNDQGIAEMVERVGFAGGIYPGQSSSYPHALTNVNGTLYFSARENVNGTELWRLSSSGQPELVEDYVDGGGLAAGGYSSNPRSHMNLNGTLYFTADDGINGSELWRIDGAGYAVLVEDTIPGGGIRSGIDGSNAHQFFELNGTVYFSANDGTNGQELWQIGDDGVASIVEDNIADGGLFPGIGNSDPGSLTNVDGTLYFAAHGGPIIGRELWAIPDDSVPPTITGVIAAGSLWSSAFVDAVDGGGVGAGNGIGYLLTSSLTMPHGGIDRIYIQFSEPVIGFNSANLMLLGTNLPDYSVFTTVTYDPVNMRGLVELSASITVDKLRLGVSDSVRDYSMGALDGDLNTVPGGIFDFRFNVLVGDANNDQSVNGGDLPLFASSFNRSAGNVAYDPRADWNSDGSVNGGDLPFFTSLFNQSLPLNEPSALNFPLPVPQKLNSDWMYSPIADDIDNYFSRFDEEEETLQHLEDAMRAAT